MKSVLLALALVLALPLPVQAERGGNARQDADRVYWTCMNDYPGGWESEYKWSKDCARIANGRGAGLNRSRRDYRLGPDRQMDRERRRCIEDRNEINTSRCLREAERFGW